eukprot:2602234-Amphidinium_carterae.2
MKGRLTFIGCRVPTIRCTTHIMICLICRSGDPHGSALASREPTPTPLGRVGQSLGADLHKADSHLAAQAGGESTLEPRAPAGVVNSSAGSSSAGSICAGLRRCLRAGCA